MAISDITIMVIGTLTVNYYLIYKKNSFLGNILFLAIGGIAMTIDTASRGLAVILIAISIISMLYDVFIYQKTNVKI